MNETIIRIKLHGMLNRYVKNEEPISLKVPATCNFSNLAESLYNAIVQKNGQLLPEKMQELQQLIMSSAFAKDDQILDDTDQNLKFQQNELIAVLPPVCGG